MKLQITATQWAVLAGLFINYMAVIATRTSVLPLFYPYMLTEFGWDSAQVTTAATVGYFLSAGLSALISPLFDRYSVRLIMLGGIVSICSGLFLYAGIGSIPVMIGVYCLLALGQALCGQVPVMVLATRWFARSRGMAIGIIMTSTSVGGAVFPLLVRPLLLEGDWRSTVTTVAIANLVLLILPWLLLIRNQPTSGKATAPAQSEPIKAASAPMRHLVCKPEFLLLALVTGGIWFIVNGMLQHHTIIMSRELSVPPATIPLVVSVYFWFAIIGKLACGYVADRLDKNLLLLLGVAFLIGGLTVLRTANADWLYFYAALFGLGFGGTASLMQILIAEYYAGVHYGKILGLLTMVDIGSGGLGIPAMAFLQRYFGSYMPVLDLLLVLCVLVAGGIVWLHLRRRALQPAAVLP